MSGQPSNRQELYDRIRESSKDEYILEEMIRLGFWDSNKELPSLLEADIRRRGELEREVRALRTEFSRLHNEDALRKELRKRRLKESREKQKETKERRLREKAERAENWKKRKETDILYLGEEVSGGLREQVNELARLKKNRLPVFVEYSELAEAMGLSVPELRFLAFNRRVSQVSHYRRYTIPKKTGGERLISAPMPRLKKAQKWILENILTGIDVHPAARGFLKGKSIKDNAAPHSHAVIAANMDLKDFFPSITYPRVRGLFRALGYSERMATIFALLVTEPAIEEVELDGVVSYVARTERALPQGSPASPAVTNLLCRRLDARLSGIAGELGFAYTRYADDISFSSKEESPRITALLARAAHIINSEGFRINKEKTRVFRRGRRQEVTGLTVNDGPAVPRKTLRNFRALLHQVELHGPKNKKWGGGKNLQSSMKGFANFVRMITPEKGEKLLSRVNEVFAKHSSSGK